MDDGAATMAMWLQWWWPWPLGKIGTAETMIAGRSDDDGYYGKGRGGGQQRWRQCRWIMERSRRWLMAASSQDREDMYRAVARLRGSDGKKEANHEEGGGVDGSKP